MTHNITFFLVGWPPVIISGTHRYRELFNIIEKLLIPSSCIIQFFKDFLGLCSTCSAPLPQEKSLLSVHLIPNVLPK